MLWMIAAEDQPADRWGEEADDNADEGQPPAGEGLRAKAVYDYQAGMGRSVSAQFTV